MLLFELFENDYDHGEHLSRTGFWGRRGAGCIFYSIESNRFLFALRSSDVQEPNTYGGYGGAIDAGESPEEAVQREAYEETGGQHIDIVQMIPLYVFKIPDVFEYYNFLVIIKEEFAPDLTWETSGYKWVEFGKWPRPLHPGMIKLLNDGSSIDKIKEIIYKYHHNENSTNLS